MQDRILFVWLSIRFIRQFHCDDMKPKLKHMKINKQSRKNYQKNLDAAKRIKECKKSLLKFLLFYCKANPSKFYHKGILALYDEGKEEELGQLIRETWLGNNTSIRRDQTGFIDNSQYLESVVDHLISEIPRIHGTSDEEYGDEWGSEEGEDTAGDKPIDEKQEEQEGGDEVRDAEQQNEAPTQEAPSPRSAAAAATTTFTGVAEEIVIVAAAAEDSLVAPKKKRKVAALSSQLQYNDDI